jgi:hypothetical protein
VHLTSPNYFNNFVSKSDLFEYNPELIQKGDSEFFDNYYLSEEDDDIDFGLENEEAVEKADIFERENNHSLACRFYFFYFIIFAFFIFFYIFLLFLLFFAFFAFLAFFAFFCFFLHYFCLFLLFLLFFTLLHHYIITLFLISKTKSNYLLLS